MAGDIDAVEEALRARAAELQARLLAQVQANLSGAVLQSRSGALLASVEAGIAEDGLGASISGDLPYAAIQEYGGRTPPHTIVPVKAHALRLANGTFAAIVHHPGSLIPARAPFGSALAALREEIAGGLKAAVLDALGAPS